MANGISSLLIGIYIIRVVLSGNSVTLLHKLELEGEFLRWALALSIILLLKDNLPNKNLGNSLISIVFVGMFLQAYSRGETAKASETIINFFKGE